MSVKVKLYKHGQSGRIQGQSGAQYDCVAGLVEVSLRDEEHMRACGWKDPPGYASRARVQRRAPAKRELTIEDLRASFENLLEQDTTALLKRLPLAMQERAVEQGVQNWALAATILLKKHGDEVAGMLEELVAPYSGAEAPEPHPSAEDIVPDAPIAQAGESEQAYVRGEGQNYTAEDLEAMTVPDLRKLFAEPPPSKLRKDQLIGQLLGA